MSDNERLIARAQYAAGVCIDEDRVDHHALFLDLVNALKKARPRTVATVEELDALPADSVVFSEETAYQKVGGEYWDGAGRGWFNTQIALPAVILHIPSTDHA